MIYRIADRTMRCSIDVPELQRADASDVDWTVTPGRTGVPRRLPAFHHWNAAGGYRWASFSRHGDRRVLHFARTARFIVDDMRRHVTCEPIGRTDEDAWRPVLLNQVLPLLLADDRLVLHASAVATPHGAVVFAAPPGRGKSTLATALALRGMPLITDDFLVIDQRAARPMALPSRVAPRLWSDSIDAILPGQRSRFPMVGPRSGKRRIASGLPLAETPSPIHRLFLLAPAASGCGVQPLSAVAAVPALSGVTFVGRVDDRATVRETFARVTSLIASVRPRQLVPVRDFARLGELCSMVESASYSN